MALASPGSGCVARYAVMISVGADAGLWKGQDACRRAPTWPNVARRMRRALASIASAWPEGDRLLALLTSRIVPLNAKGW